MTPSQVGRHIQHHRPIRVLRQEQTVRSPGQLFMPLARTHHLKLRPVRTVLKSTKGKHGLVMLNRKQILPPSLIYYLFIQPRHVLLRLELGDSRLRIRVVTPDIRKQNRVCREWSSSGQRKPQEGLLIIPSSRPLQPLYSGWTLPLRQLGSFHLPRVKSGTSTTAPFFWCDWRETSNITLHTAAS